jgi:hypothetical protein
LKRPNAIAMHSSKVRRLYFVGLLTCCLTID